MFASRRPPLRRLLAPSLLATAATLLLAGGATQLAAPAHADSTAPDAAIAVAVSDSAVTIPATVAPGFETFTVTNAGTMPHGLQIFRINDGATLDQVGAAAAQITGDPTTQAAFYALVAPYSGADTLDPATSQTFTESLATGNYVAVDTNGMNGPMATFTVSGTPTTAAAPASDWQVTESEFAFDAPATVPAGMSTVAVTNAGAQNHMLVLVRLDPGKTIQDVIDFLTNAGPDAPQPTWATTVPGVPELAPGLSAYTVLNLNPGVYAMLCFDTDPANGLPHVAEGMIGTFSVQ